MTHTGLLIRVLKIQQTDKGRNKDDQGVCPCPQVTPVLMMTKTQKGECVTMIKVEKHDFPTVYASYFVNDDPSGLTDAEIADADVILKNLAKRKVFITSCEGEYVGRWQFNEKERELLCTMSTYTCFREVKTRKKQVA